MDGINLTVNCLEKALEWRQSQSGENLDWFPTLSSKTFEVVLSTLGKIFADVVLDD